MRFLLILIALEFNSLGQTIRQVQQTGQSVNIDLSKLENGMYFVHLINSKSSNTVKILKQ